MATIADIEDRVLNRLEEANPPKFWSLQYEIRPFLVEGMYEATLITGEPQVFQSTPMAVVENETLQIMPTAAVAILKIEGLHGAVSRVSVFDLDTMQGPTWELDTDVSLNLTPGTILYWFPFGLGQWGVYPKLTVPANVAVTYVGLPVPTVLPFTGAETVPFQTEYLEAFEEYAAHAAKVKEGGLELFDGMKNYDRFLGRMNELKSFGDRTSVLRFSVSRGVPAKVTSVEVR